MSATDADKARGAEVSAALLTFTEAASAAGADPDDFALAAAAAVSRLGETLNEQMIFALTELGWCPDVHTDRGRCQALALTRLAATMAVQLLEGSPWAGSHHKALLGFKVKHDALSAKVKGGAN